jgi:hypothetical protein
MEVSQINDHALGSFGEDCVNRHTIRLSVGVPEGSISVSDVAAGP